MSLTEEVIYYCLYCGRRIYGCDGGWHVLGGSETCDSGKSPTTFHEMHK